MRERTPLSIGADRVTASWREAVLARIRARLRRRVAWQRHLWSRLGVAEAAALTHEEVDLVCAGETDLAAEREYYRTNADATRLAEFDMASRRTEQHTPMALLRSAFGLSDVDVDFLCLCLAAEWEPRLARVYGYAQDDLYLAGATRSLAAALFDWPAGTWPGADSPLVRWRLIVPRVSAEPTWSPLAIWMPDPRVAALLSHREGLAPELVAHGTWASNESPPAFEPEAGAELRRVIGQRSDGPLAVQLVGPHGVGRRFWATMACLAEGLRLLVVDTPALLGDVSAAAVNVMLAEREARLHDCALLWERADQVPPEHWRAMPLRAGVRLFSMEKPLPALHGLPHLRPIFFSIPTAAERRRLWSVVLPDAWKERDETAALLAARFQLTPSDIGRLAAAAGPSGSEALWSACREMARGGLHGLATALPCPYGWNDLVVPPDLSNNLREIVAHVAHRVPVYDTWGFGAKRPFGRGVSALFSGASGTGKTMAAQVVGAELGVVLLRIDLAGVVSKYIGETEKHLRQVFDEGERLNAVLFFDECDALFGKRTQVKDAHDRYANIEINYLLQRMESYDGLAILATNRKGDLDTAFTRRIRFFVEFPRPSVVERRAIWRLALPDRSPSGDQLLDDIDWELLATRLDLTGAEIKNIALYAAFMAYAEGCRIQMRHVARAARREMAKSGRDLGRGEHGLLPSAPG
jgi:hypothetical protein